MGFDQIVVISTVIFLILTLYKEWMRPPVAFLTAIVILNIAGILSAKDILIGFSNEQVAVIILLLVIGDIIQRTQVLDRFFDKIFSRAKSYNGFLLRMMAYVASASAFFNNTPLVAMLMPYTFSWSKKNNIAVSKLLIPLSYAAILGGATTLIGTSTNLIVGGLVTEAQANYAIDSIGVFDFAWVGVPMIIIGVLYILLVGKKLLPDGKGVMENFKKSKREYIVETIVKEGSKLNNKTVSQAGLRNLTGLFLVEIIRGDHHILPVRPDDVIIQGDHLIFAGETETVADLIEKDLGLSLPKNAYTLNDNGTGVIEAVIPFNSSLIGKKIRESDFRSRFDASILAVHRNGEKLAGRIGDIVLKSGDLMLLIGGKEVYKRTEGYNVFYILSQVKQFNEVKNRNVYIVLSALLATVIFSALNIINLFLGLLIILVFMFLSKMLTVNQLKKSTRFNIVIIAGLALALGKAMMISGTADYIAKLVIDLLEPFGIIALMFGIYFVTNVLAAYMTNIAAVSIIFPIVVSSAVQLDINPSPFILLIAFAASANFFTPIGYQTNLMVYSAGGYKFNDFLKIGLPLSILYMIGAVLILYKMYL